MPHLFIYFESSIQNSSRKIIYIYEQSRHAGIKQRKVYYSFRRQNDDADGTQFS